MWDLIVPVPYHCLFFYFGQGHTRLLMLPLNKKAIGPDVELSLCTLPGILQIVFVVIFTFKF